MWFGCRAYEGLLENSLMFCFVAFKEEGFGSIVFLKYGQSVPLVQRYRMPVDVRSCKRIAGTWECFSMKGRLRQNLATCVCIMSERRTNVKGRESSYGKQVACSVYLLPSVTCYRTVYT